MCGWTARRRRAAPLSLASVAEGSAFVFPGQGSQIVGMGRAVYEGSARARETFEEADRVLGYELSRLCFEGPNEALACTTVAQPAGLTPGGASPRAARG